MRQTLSHSLEFQKRILKFLQIFLFPIKVKSHPFFHGVDWKQVYQQNYAPPFIPPKGEVNAADACDIGNFDEDDTKAVKITEQDQEIYKDFPLTISERQVLAHSSI